MLDINVNYEGIVVGDIAESDYLDKLSEDFEGDVYLCDAIMEVGDDFAGELSYSEMINNAEYIEEAMSEAMANGLIDTKNFSFDKFLRISYYEYLTGLAYANLDIIISNYLINYVNNNEDMFAEYEEEDIENAIEEIASEQNNNDTYAEMEEKLKDKLKEISE